MNRVVLALLSAIIALLAACSGAPKVAMRPEAKQSLKRVAIVEVPEPTYSMHPGAAPGGAALYIFGALGGAILGGIEASRQEAASARFTAAIEPLKPALAVAMLEQLDSGLRAKGYETWRVPVPPKTSDGKDYDFTKMVGDHDAILVTTLVAGYAIESGAVVPRVSARVTLHPKQGTELVFSEYYLYAPRKVGELVFVESDPQFTFPSLDAVYANPGAPVAGLRAGTTKLAERIVGDL